MLKHQYRDDVTKSLVRRPEPKLGKRGPYNKLEVA
jgi:hypothetical protein